MRTNSKIAGWIRDLPKPLGLMACNDVRGQQVLNACRSVDVAVPEEAAVVGVDNEEVLCELCDPPLSSVAPNPERIGYEAAELLDRSDDRRRGPRGGTSDRADRGGECGNRPTCWGSTTRTWPRPCSTSAKTHAAASPWRRFAPIVAVSRSLLERRFRKCLGRSPQEEIRLVQLKRVKQLLADTDLAWDAIARLAGLSIPST